ncbi:aerobactin siderophore biosynthesis protein iucB [Ascodesmis nigricans]|uniref:Aerobactin siderophore biosynthesis protein iucB n=1 Tax=Ascodesmis nigricans TaxID=341454 RepID=A0A4S2MYC6_9PEZI|nr:aerobactin siderophore biosynthesis protein iucB [Ascodesmis nigricans]
MASTVSTAKEAPASGTVLKLPHPYLTSYNIAPSSKQHENRKLLQISHQGAPANAAPLPAPLHNDSLFFSNLTFLKNGQRPAESINTPWGRARRSPESVFHWTSSSAPTLGQVWLAIYAIFTVWPEFEYFRLRLDGAGKDEVAQGLQDLLMAIPHPENMTTQDDPKTVPNELLVLRSTFWQGAGSPFGARPIWALELPTSSTGPGSVKPLSNYPLAVEYTTTTKFPETRVHIRHPVRPAKPQPGSVIYSRYVPHLEENFNMVALDYKNDEHLQLFHTWQNDPRVSQGWNETGTLDQHREYLRKLHEDPHVLTILARFDDVFFAYFEVYWGKEDHLGAYYDAGDFDRGRHSLVGDIRYRGPHRVTAWWSSLMHYIFLDDPRTMFVVGEPKATNSVVLQYDFIHGFSLEKFVDLPHKRSAFVRCPRERFFQIAPLGNNPKVMGGTGVVLSTKL